MKRTHSRSNRASHLEFSVHCYGRVVIVLVAANAPCRRAVPLVCFGRSLSDRIPYHVTPAHRVRVRSIRVWGTSAPYLLLATISITCWSCCLPLYNTSARTESLNAAHTRTYAVAALKHDDDNPTLGPVGLLRIFQLGSLVISSVHF